MKHRSHPYSTNIPHARERLQTLAERLHAEGQASYAQEIMSIVENFMTRRPGPRRAPSTRRKVTDQIRRNVIRDLTKTNLPQEEIAQKYGIDGGRVSEIYRSLRN